MFNLFKVQLVHIFSLILIFRESDRFERNVERLIPIGIHSFCLFKIFYGIRETSEPRRNGQKKFDGIFNNYFISTLL